MVGKDKPYISNVSRTYLKMQNNNSDPLDLDRRQIT